VGKKFFVEASIFSSKVSLLIDTGAQVSLLQQKFVPKDIQIQKSVIDIKSYSDDDVGVLGFIDTKLVINN
jgi:hypothetical protein